MMKHRKWEVGVTSQPLVLWRSKHNVCDSSSLTPENMNINGQICFIDLSDPDLISALIRALPLQYCNNAQATQQQLIIPNASRLSVHYDSVFEKR
jgi:hypothetical protein